MKSLITSIFASAALSWPGGLSVRSQETTATLPPAVLPATEPDEEVLANALAEVQRQVAVELSPKLAAAAAEAGAQVQAAQLQVDEQLAKVFELVQAAPPAAPRAVPGAAATPGPQFLHPMRTIVNRGRGGPGKALVIRTSDADAQAQSNL